jgi:hypothetical protein
MHVAERDKPHSLMPAEQAEAMARRQELLDYFVFIDRSAEEVMEQQQALTRASAIVTSGFDGVAPAEETIRSIAGAGKPLIPPGGNPPAAVPTDPDIGF